MASVRSFFVRVCNYAFAPVDIASFAFFRIAFGLLMAGEVVHWWVKGWVWLFWIEPRFLFKYYGFSWIQPWPGNGLYIHWIVLGILGLFIAAGFFYRISAALFCLGYTYTFLLDESLWINHGYLICLFSFLLIFVPANRAVSIDAWLKPKLRSQTTPAWTLWVLRLQTGVVYFFGGIAKISPDWLHGEPMRTWLTRKSDFPILGRIFQQEWAAYGASYGALLLDLFAVPLLLWRRTRVLAFYLVLAFHLLNASLFYIGVFPWLAIAATTLFLSPSWPRRVMSLFRRTKSPESIPVSERVCPSSARQSITLGLLAIYAAIQILVPLRHFLYSGGLEWMYAEHRFGWRMMLMRHSARAFFYVTDPNDGETYQVLPTDYIELRQAGRMSWRPDMILQFAHYLAAIMPRTGPLPLRVEARVFVSLNGRKPQLLVDPNVDLASQKRTLGRPRWLLRVDGPLPTEHKDFSGHSSDSGIEF